MDYKKKPRNNRRKLQEFFIWRRWTFGKKFCWTKFLELIKEYAVIFLEFDNKFAEVVVINNCVHDSRLQEYNVNRTWLQYI